MTTTDLQPPLPATTLSPTPAPLSESRLLLILGAVQFVNVVDFVMVLPLGPDFARALGIPAHQLGLVAGSYTAAAAIVGLLAATFLDRFDRRRALLVAMLGLVTGTLAGGFATGLGSMLFARVLAGTFGGPATSLAMSILSDAVPPERRGRAVGKVMGAFSVAAVVGVPAGLEIAQLGGWQVPFFVIASLGLVVALGAAAAMPPMRGHLNAAAKALTPVRPLREFARDRTVLLSLAGTAVAMVGSFSIISNLSAYVQFNLGYPREQLGALYMAGGCVSFFSMRAAGWSVDRWGAASVVSAGTALVVTVIGLGFLGERSLLPVIGIFVGFMLANSTRIVALNALTTRVPPAPDRARFMSLQSAVQHLATSAGAGLSSWVLHERADQHLEGMSGLAAFAIVMSLALPLVVLGLQRRIRARDEAQNAARLPEMSAIAE
ncbi:MAG TPA: MFS transporter [Polyangiaceae bacterium]|nr:MFS transporter [Polyangiaceae bacterium]